MALSAPPPALSDALLEDPAAAAKAAGLRYVSDDEPGITRRRRGKGFSYLKPGGERVTDQRERRRLDALAIPPAYREVWICTSPKGHLQATGRDEKGRKQYLYHPRWREIRDGAKYCRMLAFGDILPALRRRVAQDMALPGLPRDKVLAVVVTLLETTLIRVGNTQYARSNQSYGLTTLRKKHVEVEGDTVTFEFTGKSGKDWHIEVEDPRVAEVVAACEDVPGYNLFKYFDEAGDKQVVESSDVNDYLRRISGKDITAKDFRTWAGTVLAAMALQAFEAFDTETQAKKNVVRAIENVAKQLGNTPTICRASYVHPEVIDAYFDGALAAAMKERAEEKLKALEGLRPEEAAVLAFLKGRLEQAEAA